MTRRNKQSCGKQEKYNAKTQTKITRSISANMSLLKKKYQNILGSKEPVIILRKCVLAENLLKHNSLLDDSSVMFTNTKVNLTKSNDKKNDKNSKKYKKQRNKYATNELNPELQSSKHVYNKKKDKTNSKVSVVDTKKFTFDSWNIKCDADLKAKALRNIEILKVCLEKIIVCDKNFNVVRPSEALKVFQKSDSKKKAQHTSTKEKPKNTTHNVKIKQKQNTHVKLDENKNERSYSPYSSCVDVDNFSHTAVDFSSTFFPTNYIMNKYMASLEPQNNVDIQVVNETNEDRKDLSLEEVKENKETIRKLPTTVREDMLQQNFIKLKMKDIEVSENYDKDTINGNNSITNKETDFESFSLSQAVPNRITYNNECFEMNEKENTSIKKRYRIPKLQKKETDCDKDTNYDKAINAIKNGNCSTLENNVSKDLQTKDLFNTQNKNYDLEYNGELDKEKTNVSLPSQLLPLENYNFHSVVNCNNNLDKRYTSTERLTDTLNVNYSLTYVQEKIKEDTSNNTIKYSFNGTNVLKRKYEDNNDDINGQPVKRIKLDTDCWTKNATDVCKMKDDVGTPDNTTSINSELDTKEIFPQVRSSSVDRLDYVSSTRDVVTETDETESKTDKGIPDFIKQNQIESIVDDVQDYDLLQNTRESEEVASNISEPSSTSTEVSSNEEDLQDSRDDDNDYISLFADPALLKEYDSVEPSPSEKSYDMTDKSFDNYYRHTQNEFNEMYENNNVDDTSKETKYKLRITSVQSQENVTIYKCPLLLNTFRGCCYYMIAWGKCSKSNCRFIHNFQLVLKLLYHRNEQKFFNVLEELVSKNFILFIENIFKEIVVYRADTTYILKIFMKLFELNAVTNVMATDIMQWLQTGGHPLSAIVNQLETMVNNSNFQFINWMLSAIQRCTECGEYWDTCKSLLLKTEYLEPHIIQIILQECIITKKHVQDVNVNIISKLNTETSCQINTQLLSIFNNLLKSKKSDVQAKQNVSSQSIRSVSSPINKNLDNQNDTCKTSKKSSNNDNKEAQDENSFLLHPIDNLSKPNSVHGRKRFWKFYINVYSLQKGLENNDYDHVINILNSAKKNQQTPFTSACYQILCNEIIHSQHHLSKLISYAVQVGATSMSYQILLDVAIHILARLAEESLWVLAYILLKDIHVMIKAKIDSYQFDATTIMLFTEIYLANHQPLQALTLLKKNNIIFSDRTKWKVRSIKKDDYSREQIMVFLLESLCSMYPEHAFFLFRILITDQLSNFYPIDLARFANKMVLALLRGEYNELIVHFGLLIGDYYLLLDATTYRALIASLVTIDMPLAKQLYQNAIALGIYSKPQFYPVTYLIVNSDWTDEEMFLALFNLMKQLSSNIGHAIEHVSPKNLTVYLIFENIPTEEELDYNTGTSEFYTKKLEGSKTQMKNLLKEKFDPPMFVRKRDKGKILRLNNQSVLTYLQTEHYE